MKELVAAYLEHLKTAKENQARLVAESKQPTELSLVRFVVHKEGEAGAKCEFTPDAPDRNVFDAFVRAMKTANSIPAEWVIGCLQPVTKGLLHNQKALSVVLWDVAKTSIPAQGLDLPPGILTMGLYYRQAGGNVEWGPASTE